MKRIITLIMTVSVVAAAYAGGNEEKNPLLEEFTTNYQAPPFDKIEVKHYKPAFEKLIAEVRASVDAVANNPQEPTFENTIEALEYNGRQFEIVASIFFALNSAETSPEMQAVALEISPMMTELSNYISLNEKIFARVKKLYDNSDNLGLDDVQKRLLKNNYDSFIRGGVALNQDDKKRYKEISKELSMLKLKFGQNVLADVNEYSMTITDPKVVEELPDFVKNGMAEEAAKRGVKGWVVTLQAPSYSPFMTYSSNRELKEALWKSYGSRGFRQNKNNNEAIVLRMANLRLEMARLLGYKSYADYVLVKRMAENADNVNNLLSELLNNTKEYAIKDVNAVKQYAREKGFKGEFMPWDWNYYSEKYKSEKFSISSELIKPYLKLENVERGIFALASRLYGLTFTPVEVPVFHKDVRVFEVKDRNNRFMALLYMDYFPRAGKRSGAWMTSYRDMYTTPDGKEVRPFVTITTNFTKPTANEPALLTFDEMNTLLHEFGHGLHGIMAEGRYPSMTGTSVYRDFVELPSQIMENWATEREFLDMFAVHYKTGEKMPQELIDKIVASQTYMAAYMNVRQVAYGMNDMGWHSITEPISGSVVELEKKFIEGTQIFFPEVDGVCTATGFNHIFSGGYAAGYYGYKWAEVLDADAFSLFKEKGIFNQQVAASFRENILSKGGSAHPMDLYVRFRGHKPGTKALFDRMGLK